MDNLNLPQADVEQFAATTDDLSAASSFASIILSEAKSED